MRIRSGAAAAITLGILGLTLIWQGITGNVMQTKLGETIVPRWLYVVGGLVLLVFPGLLFYVVHCRG